MDDIISRQAAIDAIWTHAIKILESYDYNVLTQDVYKMAHRHITELIEQLPSAEPAQKIGHWIREGQDGFSGYCSVCGHDLPLFREEWTEWEYAETPYCPNCGAKIEEKQ